MVEENRILTLVCFFLLSVVALLLSILLRSSSVFESTVPTIPPIVTSPNVTSVPVVTDVTTSFPLTGNGTAATPVTFAAANAVCRTVFWNGTTWNHNVPSGIVEVTVGSTIAGANFQTIQEALNVNCNFVRVISSVSEPNVLVLPTNTIIYVDPGVTLTLAAGQMDVTGRSLTLLGNASVGSSTIVLSGSLLGDVNSRIYFRDCRCENDSGGALTATSTGNFGMYHGSGTTFVTADTARCLFGDVVPTIIDLDIVDCIVEGGGGSASEFLANLTSNSILRINGLTISGSWSVGATLARTDIFPGWQVTNISVVGTGSDAANPFIWIMGAGGMMQQLKQLPGTAFVQVSMTGDDTQVNNLSIHRLVIDGPFQRMKIANVDCSGDFYFNRPIGLQMNNVRAVSDPVGLICEVRNLQSCDINNLQVTGQFDCAADDTNYSNCHISGILGTNFANNRCTFRGVYAELLVCQGIHNSYIGGAYTDINTSGIGLGSHFAFTGIRVNNTMTLSNQFHVIDNCFIENLDMGTSDFCSVSNSVIRNILICANDCIISNCKVDTGGAGNNIDVNSRNNVQISNCTVGRPILVSSNPSTITGIIAQPVGPAVPGATLIVNCKTRTAITASVNVINCVTYA